MTRHGLLWLFAIVMIFLFAPLVLSQSDYEACLVEELSDAAGWYGDEEAQKIYDRANTIYGLFMVKPGIDPAIRKHFAKPQPSKEVAPGVEMPKYLHPYAEHAMDYWANFLHNIWLFCWRVAHSWEWLIYLTPFFAAALFDGVMVRKAKLASFRYTSPTVYNLSWHVIIAMIAMAVVAFAIITPLSVYFYPVVLTMVCMLIRLVVANIQHSA